MYTYIIHAAYNFDDYWQIIDIMFCDLELHVE